MNAVNQFQQDTRPTSLPRFIEIFEMSCKKVQNKIHIYDLECGLDQPERRSNCHTAKLYENFEDIMQRVENSLKIQIKKMI